MRPVKGKVGRASVEAKALASVEASVLASVEA
jgi:hypothetical protein